MEWTASMLICAWFSIFLTVTDGFYTKLCANSGTFRCNNGDCIFKTYWCDGSYNCNDQSDEATCNTNRNYYSSGRRFVCNNTLHFRCTTGRCIPISGRCDGFTSCPDVSDEENCPCEELHDENGIIEYEADIGNYRTYQKCWKLVLNKYQFIKLNIKRVSFYSRLCTTGNLTIATPLSFFDDDNTTTICPGTKEDPIWLPHFRPEFLTLYSNVTVRYRSDWFQSEETHDMKDDFRIAYEKVDLLCQLPEAFRCNKNSCILQEEQCDGVKDCKNGLDEHNCNSALLSASHTKPYREKAVIWLKKQHDEDWGWKENTHRAIVALYLAEGVNFNDSNQDLIAKQLELQISTALLRRETEKISPTQLSMFINSLLVICHDPRNFYGFDLIANLKQELRTATGYIHPLSCLTLCNAKETISEDAVDSLYEILKTSSDLGFILEIQAAASIALTCITKNKDYYYLKENATEALNILKKEQMKDGSFGNVYTTALVLQALIANDQLKEKDWNLKSAVEYLKHTQEEDGSFGDFLSTYLILPILNGKSLVDLGNVNCTGSTKARQGNLVSAIKSKLGNKMAIKYSLFIGDEKDQIHPIMLRTPENITVLELMTLAADIDPKYRYKTHMIKQKRYIYEVSGIPNDPEDSKFWFLYEGSGNKSIMIPTQSPDEVTLNENKDIIMWYKTLKSM